MATTVETSTRTSGFLAQPKRMLVDGEWMPSRHGRTLEVYDPAVRQVFDTFRPATRRTSTERWPQPGARSSIPTGAE